MTCATVAKVNKYFDQVMAQYHREGRMGHSRFGSTVVMFWLLCIWAVAWVGAFVVDVVAHLADGSGKRN